MLDSSSDIHVTSGEIMGGRWLLRHVPVEGILPDTVRQAALDALQLVDQQMSNYARESDLMRANRAPVGTWLAIPNEMHAVMVCADTYARQSTGAINITLGAAVNMWGFGPDITPMTDPAIEISKRQIRTSGIENYRLCANPPSVMKLADITFDLCALAKGFAVDQAARAIEALGVTNFLIEASGEVFATGQRPNGQRWQVGLELPVPNEVILFDQIPLNGKAVATSGGYRNTRHIDGRTYSHTIDPKTGRPIQSNLLSVTVVDESCMHADALATVLYVLGEIEGPKFAIQNDIAAVFMIREPGGIKEIRSEAFIALD